MPKILVNYTYNKKNNKYSLLDSNVVYADLPIAEMELGNEFEEILIVPINKRATVVEKTEYLSKNKLFKLIANENGIVSEDENGTPIYLPINTDINKMRFIDGQLVLIENNEEREDIE